MSTCIASGSDIYKLENLKRVSDNIYQSGSVIVQTRYCYEYTYSDSSILKYEGSGEYSGSKLIFSSGTSCDVQKVLGSDRASSGDVPGGTASIGNLITGLGKQRAEAQESQARVAQVSAQTARIQEETRRLQSENTTTASSLSLTPVPNPPPQTSGRFPPNSAFLFMTYTDYLRFGLDRLSDKEISALDVWLKDFAKRMAITPTKKDQKKQKRNEQRKAVLDGLFGEQPRRQR